MGGSAYKHTPGPWYCDTDYGCKAIGPATGVFGEQVGEAIADTVGIDDESEDLANACLIAAAPDLLKPCKMALEAIYAGSDDWMIQEVEACCKAAIAKAEGHGCGGGGWNEQERSHRN